MRVCGELSAVELWEMNKVFQKRGALVTKNWQTGETLLKHPRAIIDVCFEPHCPIEEIHEAFEALNELEDEEKDTE